MPNVGASMEYNSLHIAGFHCREKGSVAFINDCLLPLDISASRAAGCAAWGAGRAALLGWADTAMWVSLRQAWPRGTLGSCCPCAIPL